MSNVEEAKKCLDAFGSAIRGDWSDIDGRSVRRQLAVINEVLDGKYTYDEFCDMVGIDKETQSWED
jgi:hypothetical protein